MRNEEFDKLVAGNLGTLPRKPGDATHVFPSFVGNPETCVTGCGRSGITIRAMRGIAAS